MRGFLGLAAFLAAAGVASADEQSVETVGRVTDLAGAPLRGVLVFAASAKSDEVTAMAASDENGLVRFVLATAERHNFGVLSSNRPVVRHTFAAGKAFSLTLGAPIVEAPAAGPAVSLTASRARILRGRVQDETGDPLGGVRVLVARSDGSVTTSAISDSAGRVVVALAPGKVFLSAVAPGLKLQKGTVRRGTVELVMGIDASTQVLEFHEGHVLRFRLEDSLDPEYLPPAPVRTWLCWAYGIGLPERPLTSQERQRVRKYWYLAKLREAPPNPATVVKFGDVSCPASSWAAAAALAPTRPGQPAAPQPR